MSDWFAYRQLERAVEAIAERHSLNGSPFAEVADIGSWDQQRQILSMFGELPTDIARVSAALKVGFWLSSERSQLRAVPLTSHSDSCATTIRRKAKSQL